MFRAILLIMHDADKRLKGYDFEKRSFQGAKMFIPMSLLVLLGCPLPPSEQSSNELSIPQAGRGGMQGGQKGQQGAGRPQGAPPNVGAGGNSAADKAPEQAPQMGGAAGGVLMDMEQMKAQKTQEEITSGDYVTISGNIQGNCDGDLRLDAIGTEDLGAPKDGGELKGPITSKMLSQSGAFSIVVPRNSSVNLSALCDADKNKKITADVDRLSLGARLGIIEKDLSDVSLVLEEIKPPSGDLPPPKE